MKAGVLFMAGRWCGRVERGVQGRGAVALRTSATCAGKKWKSLSSGMSSVSIPPAAVASAIQPRSCAAEKRGALGRPSARPAA
jgi:hypothetical protein